MKQIDHLREHGDPGETVEWVCASCGPVKHTGGPPEDRPHPLVFLIYCVFASFTLLVPIGTVVWLFSR